MKLLQALLLVSTLFLTTNIHCSQTMKDLATKTHNWVTSVSHQVGNQLHDFFHPTEDTHEVTKTIEEKPNASTPTITKVKTYIAALSADSSDAQFNCAQDALTGLRLRAQDNLYKKWHTSYASGFKKTDIDSPDGAYVHLGMDKGKHTCTTMMVAINFLIGHHEKNSEENARTLFTLRELGNIFRCPINKENYDAFLQGTNAVNALQITESQEAEVLALQELLYAKKFAQQEKLLAAHRSQKPTNQH